MNTVHAIGNRPAVLASEEQEVQRTSNRNKNKNNACCGYPSKSTYVQPACSKNTGYVQQGYQQGCEQALAPAASSSSGSNQGGGARCLSAPGQHPAKPAYPAPGEPVNVQKLD